MTPSSTEFTPARSRSDYHSAFEQLLTALSTRFINLPIDSIDHGIAEALGQVGKYTGVDRCFVYQFTDSTQTTIRLSHEWCAEGVPAIKDRLQNVQVEPLRWAVDQLRDGRVVHVSDASELPPEAEPLRQLYVQLGVRSAFYVPLFFKSGLPGMLGLSCMRANRAWPEEDIALLRVVGEIVVNAIDRRQDFRELQQAKELYQAVVEDQTDFIVRWKPDGTHVFVNRAVCRYLQRPLAQVMASNVFDHIHTEDAPQLRSQLAELTPKNPLHRIEHRVLLPNGEVAWQDWSNRALFDDEGHVVEYLSVGRDVTQRKYAQLELEYRRKLENLILNLAIRFINLPAERLEEGIVEALQQVGDFVQGDRTFIYFLNTESGLATLAFEWLSPEAVATPETLAEISLVKHDWGIPTLQSGQPLVLTDLAQWPAGEDEVLDALRSINTQSFVMVPVFYQSELFAAMGIASTNKGRVWSPESTAILRLLGEVLINALERRRWEEALATSERRLSLTVDAVSDGFYDWDLVSGRLYVSDNWLAGRGLQGDGQPWTSAAWHDAIHPEDAAQVDYRLREHLAGNTEVFECDYRVRMADDSWRWTANRGRVVERHGDAPTRMVGVERDITQEVENLQRLKETENRLTHLARLATMGEVVAGIAHEVNQPLHAASLFANAISTALETGNSQRQQRVPEMVRKITREIERAADIIRRLRNFTKPHQVCMTHFDLNALIRESAEMLNFDAKSKQVRVEFELDATLPPVMGDAVQIQQVVVNLLRNAYEAVASTQGTQSLVRITTQKRHNGLLMQVLDNGPGLDSSTPLESLFDAFVTTKEEGMGMGLALSRSIITSHHGKIWGESNPLGGMTFCVLLPIHDGFNDE